MLVYGGEVDERPPKLLILASVAPMAPRVKRERMGGSDFGTFGLLSSRKVRNLGCGQRPDFGSGL